MTIFEYWMGKNIDLEQVWSDYESGQGYITKFQTRKPYLIRLTFERQSSDLPLFDHEAIYKTVKGVFQDIKYDCLSTEAYDTATPIFLYRVDRGSALYEFCAEFAPLIPFVMTIGAVLFGYQKYMEVDQRRLQEGWRFIRSEFPEASDEDYASYVTAWSHWQKHLILRHFIERGLYKVEVSKEPFNKGQPSENLEMIDIVPLARRILGYPDGEAP